MLAAVGQAADKLVLLDGTAIQDTVTAIDAQGAVRCQGRPQPLDLQALRRIERAVPGAQAPAPCDVFLSGGGVIHAQSVLFDGQRFSVMWAAYQGYVFLPLAAAQGLRLGALPGAAPGASAPAFEAALAQDEVRRDELFAIAEGALEVVRGGLQAIGPDEVRFIWNDAERKVPRPRVYGLVLAHKAARPNHTGQCLVELKDGSSVWGVVKGLADGSLSVRVAAGLDLAVPWEAVCRLTVCSSRCAFLSDLDPVEVVEEPVVTYAGPWRRDRSVLNQPLTLGKAVYEKGLGVHSRCRLSYALDGRFDLFAATIGIDASTGGKGDCVFVVLADGKELFRKPMRGADAPADVRVKVAGAQRLTLLVDLGEDLDLADRANWCDARVIRETK